MDFDDVSLNDDIFFIDYVPEVVYEVDSSEVDTSDVSSGEVLVYFDSVSDNDISGNDDFVMLSNLSETSADYSETLAEIQTELGEINTNLNLIIGIGLFWLAFYFSKRLINMFKE